MNVKLNGADISVVVDTVSDVTLMFLLPIYASCRRHYSHILLQVHPIQVTKLLCLVNLEQMFPFKDVLLIFVLT